jgi:TrmH family RNA methyltransferase
MISSPRNPKILHIRSLLSQRKTREEFKEFVVEGVRLCEEATAARINPRQVLFTARISERGMSLIQSLEGEGCEVEEIPEQLMAALSETETSQGILAVVPYPNLPSLQAKTFTVVADEIRDPGNLGTLIRSAAAAGVDEFIITPGTADPFSPKVVRSGMGAHFRLPIRERDWSEIAVDFPSQQAGERRILLADMAGEPMWDIDLTNPLVLIIGGEADGGSIQARKTANGLIGIPMPGESESLNAAVAGSVLIFEVLRQRHR